MNRDSQRRAAAFDFLTDQEAQELIDEAREMVAEGADPEDVLYNEFGLEPDFIWDLLE